MHGKMLARSMKGTEETVYISLLSCIGATMRDGGRLNGRKLFGDGEKWRARLAAIMASSPRPKSRITARWWSLLPGICDDIFSSCAAEAWPRASCRARRGGRNRPWRHCAHILRSTYIGMNMAAGM